MTLRSVLLLSVVASSLTTGANAQIVFQAPVAITQNPSDISTSGTYVDAVGSDNDPFGSSAITVGDTTFHSIFSDSGIVLTNVGPGSDGSGSTSTPFKTVLDGVAYTGDFNSADLFTATVSLNNLKVGDVYQVQFFSLGGFKTEVNGANSVVVNGQYTVGTFTALGAGPLTSQTFTFDSSISGVGEVNAITLRDLTALPEPSTYAMMLGGLALLAFAFRRQLVR